MVAVDPPEQHPFPVDVDAVPGADLDGAETEPLTRTVEETPFPVSRVDRPLSRAIGASRGRTVLLMDPDLLQLIPVAERLAHRVSAGS